MVATNFAFSLPDVFVPKKTTCHFHPRESCVNNSGVPARRTYSMGTTCSPPRRTFRIASLAHRPPTPAMPRSGQRKVHKICCPFPLPQDLPLPSSLRLSPCPMFVFKSALGQWRRSRRDVNQVVGDAEDLETIAATSLLGGR